jgi:RNA recognition motif-containing protein
VSTVLIIIVDRETGKCKGFGFIEMSSPEEASVCILKLDSKDFMGRAMRVNVATTKKEKPAFRTNY